MTVTIQGQINEVGPAIAGGYAVGQIAQLYVECLVQGTRAWYDMAANYPLFYSIEPFMGSLAPLETVVFRWPWTTYQEWQIRKTITIAPMPNQDLNGTFLLWEGTPIVLMAASDGQEISQSPYPILLDSREFTIPVVGGNGGGDGGNAPSIPWKEIAIGLGIGAVVGLVVSAGRRTS
jgi:hypothetical protein